MNRSDFIKSLGLGTGGIILPKSLFLQKKIKIYDNYLSGLSYYEYKSIASQLTEGTELYLKREIENLHDRFAVEVYFQNSKIGYLRAFENIIIANMLDAGVDLTLYVSCHKQEENLYKNQTLSVAIYAEMITATPKLISELNEIRADDAFDLYRKNI